MRYKALTLSSALRARLETVLKPARPIPLREYARQTQAGNDNESDSLIHKVESTAKAVKAVKAAEHG